MESLKLNESHQHKLDEPAIIKRIIGGEKELYEILVRRNNQKLYRIIRSYLSEEVEIEDVMQDSYLVAYAKLSQFKLESSFSTWLIRIAINESLARLRKKGKMFLLTYSGEKGKNRSTIEILDHRQVNPQEKMINNETKQLLENAIEQLDVKYKTVYIMKELEGMSLKEIAGTLDISVSNVKVRLHRSKEMLKEKLYNLSISTDVFEFGFSRCDRITENVMKLIN